MQTAISLLLALVLVPAFSSAQTLCNVSQVRLSGDEVIVDFDRRADLDILALGHTKDEGNRRFKIQSGQLVAKGVPVDGIVLSEGEAIYINRGFTQSCVVRAGRSGARKGIHIEEQIHVRQQPPKLRAEFVQAY